MRYELGTKLHHADILQTLFIIGLKCKLPALISDWIGFTAKIEQDLACRKFVKDCDIFLFYNGCGLNSLRYAKKNGTINIVEVVNSHVEYQESILKNEYSKLNLLWKPFPKYEKMVRMKEYEEADYILLPSEFVKKSFISKGFPEEKLLKVPYRFSNRIHNTKNESYCDGFTVLYVGTICVRKGIRYLIDAFHKLIHPQKKLVIVGPDSNDGALNDVTLTPDIIIKGVLKGAQLEEAYKSASVFCLPSIEDGFGLVISEALSYGLPVIATINTGADEIITDGVEGFIVPIQNSEAMFMKMQMLADDTKLYKKMKIAILEKLSTLMGWEETGVQLIDILQKVYDKKKKFVNA